MLSTFDKIAVIVLTICGVSIVYIGYVIDSGWIRFLGAFIIGAMAVIVYNMYKAYRNRRRW